jgi:hypothetical protein
MAFKLAKDIVYKLNLLWSSQGFAGCGKTYFGYTGPEPIYHFMFEPSGQRGVVDRKEFRKKEIHIADYSEMANLGRFRDVKDRVKAAGEVLLAFREDFDTFLKAGQTGLIDKEDALWEMMRLAYHKDYSANPKDYAELNIEMVGWLSSADVAGRNLGMIRGVKEEWGITGYSSQGKPQRGGLGTYIPRGSGLVAEHVQIQLLHTLVEGGKDCQCEEKDGDNHFEAKIVGKCRVGDALELVGKTHCNLEFLDLAMMLYPDSRPDDWGL